MRHENDPEAAPPTDDEKMAGYLSTIESGAASDDESIKAKEAAVLALSALYAKRRESEKLAALLVTLRPLFAAIPKAKTAKLVKRLIAPTPLAGRAEDLRQICLNPEASLMESPLNQLLFS